MPDTFRVAIVGSGPAGLSAAARAAELGLSHILLEAEQQLANTIFRYQKGKHVMAEPAVLPLRAPIPFEAGSREAVLACWSQAVQRLGVNFRLGAEVSAITPRDGGFAIRLGSGEQIAAQRCVLAIGLQGNLRKLGVDGEDLPFVQYQLDDPDEFANETIVVVGAGDAAIENALALARQNRVILVNRRDEFARAKEGNLKAILKAIDDGLIECYYNSRPLRVEALSAGRKPGRLWLATAAGEARVLVDRIVARLGANPPRAFVEACGVVFPSRDPAAVPAVSPTYESNVPGLYIIGALAGYPLIKQAMNQGFEVIEAIEGRCVEPADEPLLRAKLAKLPGFDNVDGALDQIQGRVPLLATITRLQLREFLLDSEVRAPRAGELLYRRNDYSSSLFSIVAGSIELRLEDDAGTTVTLTAGEFFGEMSLISGRRRSASAVAGPNCVLIETPRRTMLRLIASVDAVREQIDRTFIARAIRSRFAPTAPASLIDAIARRAVLRRFRAGEQLFAEGEPGRSLHLIRLGSVTVSRLIGGREVVLSYVPAGHYVGEMALLGEGQRTATVRAAIATETIELDQAAFQLLLDEVPGLYARLQAEFRQRTAANIAMQATESGGDIIGFLISQGIGEATDVLLIDEDLCVRCDNCEKACAETHGGTSRLDREAGPTFASVHVPTSCRHCEHPHCMKDCPPDAIHRAPNGEVFIADNCIGCGNCERNCPYGVIHMASPTARKPGLLSWLLFGLGPGPGQAPAKAAGKAPVEKKAVKCDMCKDLAGGPACVRSCPTGAAIRIRPEDLPRYARSR